MRIIHTLDEMTETARGWLADGSVGFVPTMGYLHEGHRMLIRTVQQECEISVVSIFVNPLQFPSKEDWAQYPRDLARDLHMLSAEHIDVVFIPRVEDMFPPHFSTYVTPFGQIVERLEGTISPGYGRGVATEITKFFQLVRPDVAYFGQKDALQVAVVRQIVRDLNIDVKLQILPTTREHDGLAMSSRNHSLSPAERQAASILYRALLAGKALIDKGERSPAVIEKAMADLVAVESLVTLAYVSVCHPDTFNPVEEVKPQTLLAIAAYIGRTHLADNILWMGENDWLI